MIDKIIKFLGGYTKYEYDLLASTTEGWRGRATAAETSVQLFNEIMTRERERAQRLEDKLSDIARGPQSQPQEAPRMQPVGNSVSSWPKIRREMEKMHRVNNDAQVSRGEIEKEIRQG